MREEILTAFREKFGREPEAEAFAPGRVNLIGEHIDYNGGHVFPAALSLGSWGAAARRQDGKLNFYSLNFKGVGLISIPDQQLVNDKRDHWSNYAKAMIQTFREEGAEISGGLDLVIGGNIPPSSGLSSSASVEVLCAFLLKALYRLNYSSHKIALLAQKAENHFIGVNCGIMDQYAIAMCRKGKAMLLNTASLQYDLAPLELGDYRLLIASTNKQRGLGASAYNKRRSECEAALADLRTLRPGLNALCELKPEEFETLGKAIRNAQCLRRARHAVYEEERTLRAFSALKNGELREFGKLMSASHDSLRDDFAVSCPELDLLVDLARKENGCLGSRMTGAGFGGCTVSLIHKDRVQTFVAEAGAAYARAIGYEASFYPVEAGSGACLLQA